MNQRAEPKSAPAGAPADWHREDAAFTRIVDRVEGRARAKERVRWLGLGYVILHGLGMVGAAITFLAIAPWGFVSGDPTATWVLGGLGAVLSGFIAAISMPGLLAGFGLLQRRPWGRSLALLLSALSLFAFPLGTIVGVLGFYILLQDDVRDLFDGVRP